MTTVSDQNKAAHLVQQVQSVLDQHQPEDYRIYVVSEAIREEDDWYYIPVRSDGDRRDKGFYFILSDVEAAIEEKHFIHVLLIPAL